MATDPASPFNVLTLTTTEFLKKTLTEQQEFVTECLDNGQPFVLTGLDKNEYWSSTEPQGRYNACVPDSLRVEAENNLSRHMVSVPESVKKTSFQTVSAIIPCEKAPWAQAEHALMVQAGTDSSLKWYITAPQNCHAMTVFLRHHQNSNPSQKDMKEESWSELPFAFYEYRQQVGELVVFPRRSYRQAFRNGLNDSSISVIRWSTFTRSSVVEAFYEERPISRRLCLEEEIPLQPLCEAVLTKASRGGIDFSMADVDAVVEIFDRMLQLERLPANFKVIERGVQDSVHSPDNDAIIHNSEGDLQCGFCRTFYVGLRLVCTNGTGCDGNHSPRSVCVECFTEGRSCRCRRMAFETSRLATDLETLRNKAVEQYQLTPERRQEASALSEVTQAAVLLQRSLFKYYGKTLAPKSCIGAGGGLSHNAPSNEIYACREGCGGQQLCTLHALVRRCMHSIDLINHPSSTGIPTDAPTTFHSTHQEYTARFHQSFRYHRGPTRHNQFLMPAAWEMKNQLSKVNRVWLALVFTPAIEEEMGSHASIGWYDKVEVRPEWVVKEHVPKSSRPRASTTIAESRRIPHNPDAATSPVILKRKLKEIEPPQAPNVRQRTSSPLSHQIVQPRVHTQPPHSPSDAREQQQSVVCHHSSSPAPFAFQPTEHVQPGEERSFVIKATRKQVIASYSSLCRAIVKTKNILPAEDIQGISRAMKDIEEVLEIRFLELDLEGPKH